MFWFGVFLIKGGSYLKSSSIAMFYDGSSPRVDLKWTKRDKFVSNVLQENESTRRLKTDQERDKYDGDRIERVDLK